MRRERDEEGSGNWVGQARSGLKLGRGFKSSLRSCEVVGVRMGEEDVRVGSGRVWGEEGTDVVAEWPSNICRRQRY